MSSYYRRITGGFPEGVVYVEWKEKEEGGYPAKFVVSSDDFGKWGYLDEGTIRLLKKMFPELRIEDTLVYCEVRDIKKGIEMIRKFLEYSEAFSEGIG